MLLLVATDASALVALITRFTEEAFATLISVVFIIQAFEKLFEISYEAPITRHPQEVLHSACHCIIQTEELLAMPSGEGNSRTSHFCPISVELHGLQKSVSRRQSLRGIG